MYMRVYSVFFSFSTKFIRLIVDNRQWYLIAMFIESPQLLSFCCDLFVQPYYVRLTSAVNNVRKSQERRCTCECAPYFFLQLHNYARQYSSNHTRLNALIELCKISIFVGLPCVILERYYVPLTSAVNNGEESQERRCTCECAPYFFFFSWHLPQKLCFRGCLSSLCAYLYIIGMYFVLIQVFKIVRNSQFQHAKCCFFSSIRHIKVDF